MARPTETVVHAGYLPGAIGRIVELHGAYYAEHWGFGAFFEARVARELAQFVDRFDPRRDGIWTATVAGRVVGSIAVQATGAGDGEAHLRWFIVGEDQQGGGRGGGCSMRPSPSAAAAVTAASLSGRSRGSTRRGGSTSRRGSGSSSSGSGPSGGPRSRSSRSNWC